MDTSIRILEPKELPYLTLKEDIEDDLRIYSESLCLGIYDSEDNYREASEEEKQEWELRLQIAQLNEILYN